MNRVDYEERRKVYEQAININGLETQIHKAIEEMSELTKELCKSFYPNGTTLDKIADEIADVTIMMEQMRLAFDLNDLVCEHMDSKVERLKDRLEKSKQEAAGRES